MQDKHVVCYVKLFNLQSPYFYHKQGYNFDET